MYNVSHSTSSSLSQTDFKKAISVDGCFYGLFDVSNFLPTESSDIYAHFVSQSGTDQPKESEVSLKVSVLSVPFVPLTFESASYSKSLPEAASIGSTVVFTVKASRSGSHAGIKYSIVGGDPDNTFTIDSDNGKITLAKALDYETKKFYRLIIRATLPSSNNAPDVTAEVVGEVTVTDVNDNKPRFLLYQSVTQIAIESYTPSATTVIQVNKLKLKYAFSHQWNVRNDGLVLLPNTKYVAALKLFRAAVCCCCFFFFFKF